MMRKFRRIFNICRTLAVTAVAALSLSASAANPDFTVVIDAGHGGHDTGATDNGAREKDINLAVALKLGEKIKKGMKDVKVIYTRDDDTFRTLQERADIANNAKGNLFISIHTNSIDKNNPRRLTVQGSQVYALGLHKDASNMKVAQRENSVITLEKDYKTAYQGFDPNKDESYIIFEMAQKKNLSKSLKFAKDVEKELVSTAGRCDRGVHQAGFWVLWATSMPAVLVELDFICNPSSARFMTSKEGQDKLAKSIFNAVKDFHKKEIRDAPGAGASGKYTSAGSSKAAGGRNRAGGSRSNRTGAAPHPAETPDAVHTAAVTTDGVAVLPKAREEAPRRHQYAAPSKSYASTGRKRRNSKARELSDKAILQVAEIPVSSEAQYIASITAEDEDSTAKSSESENKTVSGQFNKETKQSKTARRGRHTSKVQKFETVYTIQLFASEDMLRTGDSRFHGLSPLSMYKENNTYKYIYGENKNRREIEVIFDSLKKDFPDAKIIESKRNVAD